MALYEKIQSSDISSDKSSDEISLKKTFMSSKINDKRFQFNSPVYLT